MCWWRVEARHKDKGMRFEMNEGPEPICSDKLFTLTFLKPVLPAASHWACQVPTKVGMGGDVSIMGRNVVTNSEPLEKDQTSLEWRTVLNMSVW